VIEVIMSDRGVITEGLSTGDDLACLCPGETPFSPTHSSGSARGAQAGGRLATPMDLLGREGRIAFAIGAGRPGHI
jgi:hypothetical protein